MLNSIFSPANANISNIHGHHYDRVENNHEYNNDDEGDIEVTGVAQKSAVTKTASPQGNLSKKQIAGLVYGKLVGAGKPRKEVIGEMVTQADLTLNGASTYYQNFKSGQWDWNPDSKSSTIAAVEPPVVVQVNFDVMSVAQLLDYYNSRALIKLSGFVSREDAMNMITKYCK